jgi:hypothetical protein
MSRRICWPCTPFIPCWGERSSSSFHALRRVLHWYSSMDKAMSQRADCLAPRSHRLCQTCLSIKKRDRWKKMQGVPPFLEKCKNPNLSLCDPTLQRANKPTRPTSRWANKPVVWLPGATQGATQCPTQRATRLPAITRGWGLFVSLLFVGCLVGVLEVLAYKPTHFYIQKYKAGRSKKNETSLIIYGR